MAAADRMSGHSPAETEAAQKMAAGPAVTPGPAGQTRALSGRGKVYSFSTMYNVPRGFESQQPYTVALIKLDDGPMVTAQLTDIDTVDVHIGLPVEMVTRKLREEGDEGQIIYGFKFRPILPTVAPQTSSET